jgi:hypothetical protein
VHVCVYRGECSYVYEYPKFGMSIVFTANYSFSGR